MCVKHDSVSAFVFDCVLTLTMNVFYVSVLPFCDACWWFDVLAYCASLMWSNLHPKTAGMRGSKVMEVSCDMVFTFLHGTLQTSSWLQKQ